jgi:hypothetical protein
VRDAGTQIHLTETTVEAWRCSQRRLFESSHLAPRLVATSSFAEVEQVVKDVCGFCEMDYERAKAEKLRASPARAVPDIESVEALLASFEADTAGRGADFVTFRRLAEAVKAPPSHYERLRADLIRRRPHRYIAPLWRVHDAR